MAHSTDEPDEGSIAEIEAVCAEIVEELRGMRDMLWMYRETVADAARYIARGPAAPADPAAHELASALARMGGVQAEVAQLLAVPAEAARVTVRRR